MWKRSGSERMKRPLGSRPLIPYAHGNHTFLPLCSLMASHSTSDFTHHTQEQSAFWKLPRWFRPMYLATRPLRVGPDHQVTRVLYLVLPPPRLTPLTIA